MELDRCPHCGRPALFPNVRLAEDPSEIEALDARYRAALDEARANGAENAVTDLEHVARRSVAVIARGVLETERLASSEREVYATYYQLLEGGVRMPEASIWEPLRMAIDSALFGTYGREVRFAALSIDGLAPGRYGDCSWTLKEAMISHRATAYEGNSVVRLRSLKVETLAALPPGHRATWAERAKLCVAKLAAFLTPTTNRDDIEKLVACDGATPSHDNFVEIHIGGPLTIRSIEKVVLRGPHKKAHIKRLREDLAKHGVSLEAR